MAIHNKLIPSNEEVASALANRAVRLAEGAQTRGNGTQSILNDDGSRTVTGPTVTHSASSTDTTGVTTATHVGDTTPPGKPTGIQCSTQSGVITVSWDGTLEDGIPGDFAYTTIYVVSRGLQVKWKDLASHKWSDLAQKNWQEFLVPTDVGGLVLGHLTHAGSLTTAELTPGATYDVYASAEDDACLADGTPAHNVSQIYEYPDGIKVSGSAASVAMTAQQAKDAADAANAHASQASQDAAHAAGLVGDKANVFYQSTEPNAQYRNDNTLWIDSANGANTPKVWGGGSWIPVTDKKAIDAANAAVAAQNTADHALAEAASAAGNNQFFWHDAKGANVSGTGNQNVSGKHSLMDSRGLHLMNGNTVTDEFTDTGVSLGKNSPTAEIDMCGGHINFKTNANGGIYTGDIRSDTQISISAGNDNNGYVSWIGVDKNGKFILDVDTIAFGSGYSAPLYRLAALLTDTGWVTLYHDSVGSIRYKKKMGFVIVNFFGIILNGGVNQWWLAGTLPNGFRPNIDMRFALANDANNIAMCQIAASGQVRCTAHGSGNTLSGTVYAPLS